MPDPSEPQEGAAIANSPSPVPEEDWRDQNMRQTALDIAGRSIAPNDIESVLAAAQAFYNFLKGTPTNG